MFYSFDDYWKQFGRFHHEVIINSPDLEKDFYNLSRKVWDDAGGTDNETYEYGHIEGYECCERDMKTK